MAVVDTFWAETLPRVLKNALVKTIRRSDVCWSFDGPKCNVRRFCFFSCCTVQPSRSGFLNSPVPALAKPYESFFFVIAGLIPSSVVFIKERWHSYPNPVWCVVTDLCLSCSAMFEFGRKEFSWGFARDSVCVMR